MNWQRAAKKLYGEVGASLVSEKVSNAILQSNKPLYLACSGGADSLLALLYFFAHPEVSELKVLHYNHALRGEASDEDARFVELVSEQLGLPYASDIALWGKEIEKVSEDDARTKRLAFFERAVEADGVGSACIVTGHHGGDVAETMLMRLSRGAGLQGLSAPREVSRCSARIQFLRPLLGLDSRKIRNALRSCDVEWREDDTNCDDDFYRNRVRLSVIPAWEAAADRPIGAGVARSRMLLEEDFEAMEAFVDREFKRILDPNTPLELASDELARLPRGVRRRLLIRWMSERCGSCLASARVMDAVVLRVQERADFSYDLSPAWALRGDCSRVSLTPRARAQAIAWPKFALPIGSCSFLPDGAKVEAEQLPMTASFFEELRRRTPQDDLVSALVSSEGNQLPSIFVRQRHAGDAFVPCGKSSLKKLKDLLIDRKIKVDCRDRLPVFVLERGDIVWVPGLPPSAKHLVSEKTEYALRLTYHK